MAAATRKARNQRVPRSARIPRSKAYTAGLKIRRRWLGKAYVDKAFRDADDFTLDLQHYVTEHAWGASWARGVLPLKTRAFMNLAMISALNRPHELEIHLRAAIRNGMTKGRSRKPSCTSPSTAARRRRWTASASRRRFSPSRTAPNVMFMQALRNNSSTIFQTKLIIAAYDAAWTSPN